MTVSNTAHTKNTTRTFPGWWEMKDTICWWEVKAEIVQISNVI